MISYAFQIANALEKTHIKKFYSMSKEQSNPLYGISQYCLAFYTPIVLCYTVKWPKIHIFDYQEQDINYIID